MSGLAGVAIVLTLLGAGLVSVCYFRSLRVSRSRIGSTSRLASTASGRIDYATSDDASAASAHHLPILIIHGAGGGWDQGLDVGAPLAARGFRLIAPSRFGYLRTPLPADASPAAQADAHAHLLDTLGIARVAVIGVSAGGPSTLQFALRHPHRVSALVLLVPAAYAPRPGGRPSLATPSWTRVLFGTALRWDFLWWAAIRCARRIVTESIVGTPWAIVKSAAPGEQARVAQVIERIMPVSARRLGLLNDAAVVGSLERYELERIAAPALIFAARDCGFGTFEPARYTAQHIPGARFVAFETGGHLCVGHQAEIIEEVVRLLDRPNDLPVNTATDAR